MDNDESGTLVNQEREGYGVGPMPGRKRRALYYVKGNTYTPVAYFKTDTDAIDFWNWLCKVTGAAQARGQGFGKKRKGESKP